MPIPGTLEQLAQVQLPKQIEELPQELQHASHKLDQMELVDYLKNQGQWSSSLIKDHPVNLEHMLTGQSEAPAAAAKGGKAAPAKQPAAEQIVLEEGDTELPMECPNNFILGDAIE